MKAIERLLPALALVLGAAVLCGAMLVVVWSSKTEDEVFGVPWAPYTPSVGRYTISFPRRPHESSTPPSMPPIIHLASFSIERDDGPDEDYRVEYTQIRKPGDVEKALDAGIADLAVRHHWTETSRRKITLRGQYPGRAVTFRSSDSTDRGVVRAREYIVEDRRYVLFCAGVTDQANANRFLDSFRIGP